MVVLALVAIRALGRGIGRSGRPAVVVMQPAQHGDGDDERSWTGRRPRPQGARDGLPDALVWPRGVEVRGVLPQHASQLPLAQDQDMIEALAPDAPEEALAGGICPRGPDGRAQDGDPAARRHAGEPRPVLAIVVADQKPGPLVE